MGFRSFGAVAELILRRTLPDGQLNWASLRRFLDTLGERGVPIRLWWRDDDAVAATPALDQLLSLRDEFAIPLALAVIPASVEPSLAAALAGRSEVAVLQHGWNHASHGTRFHSEFPETRDPAEVGRQLAHGRQILAGLFGRQFRPVLVPPFNAIAQPLARLAIDAGYSSISVKGDFDPPATARLNVHVDVIDWGARPPTACAVAAVVRQAMIPLIMRRCGVAVAAPIGLVTHHLAMDTASWAMTRAFLELMTGHPAVTTVGVDEAGR